MSYDDDAQELERLRAENRALAEAKQTLEQSNAQLRKQAEERPDPKVAAASAFDAAKKAGKPLDEAQAAFVGATVIAAAEQSPAPGDHPEIEQLVALQVEAQLAKQRAETGE